MNPLLLLLVLAAGAQGAAAAAGSPAAVGAAQLAKGDADAAIAAYEKAVALDPANSRLHHQLGEAYGLAAQKAGMLGKMNLGKKCRLAYEKAVELDPANLDARSSLLGFYQMAPAVMGGGMDKAYAQAAAIRQADAGRGRLAYATLYAAEKKYAEAFAELEAVLQSAPGNYPALYQFGRLAALTGERIGRGIAALEMCLTLPPAPGSPGHDAANWRLGNLWEKQGDQAAARAAYRAALAINPGFQQAVDALRKLN